jgi:murein DD-endopeptidase MepM/ murein hydrolase activator NlpD
MLPVRIWLAVFLSLVCLPLAKAASAAVQPGNYAWPVRGPVIRPYEAPSSPYGSGHRGIDIAVPFGTSIVAAQDGMVSFAGWVAGALFISVDHPDGVRTTYSWLSAVSVKKGDAVARGQVIGNTGHGHPDVSTPHLHFGARIGETYIDPMTLLEPANVVGLIHLGPLDEGSPPSPILSGVHAA